MNNTQNKKEFTLKATVEKLDGGYISNVTGKRKIFKNSTDIDEAINIASIFSDMDDQEYVLSIKLISTEDYNPLEDHEEEEEEVVQAPANDAVQGDGKINYLEQAKEQGIIVTEQYNPVKEAAHVVEDLGAPIVVDIKSSYSVSKLKSIPWAKWDLDHTLTLQQKSDISGMAYNSLYVLWKKMCNHKASYERAETRVKMTTLAKYYEKHLGLKSTAKEQMDELKKVTLKILRDLEVTAGANKYTKSSEVMKKIVEMRKELLKP